MKVLIQNCDSHEYLAEDDRWVRDHECAFVFSSSIKALEYMSEKALKTVQIVLKFDNPRFDAPVSKTEGCD